MLKARSRNRQPRQAVGVNSSDPSARGLVALIDVRAGIDLVSGARAKTDTSTRLPSLSGVGADFVGGQSQTYAHRSGYALTGPLSILLLIDVDALSNYGALISKQATAATKTPYELRLGVGPGDFQLIFGRAGDAQLYQATTGSNRLAAGDRSVRLLFMDPSSTLAATQTVWVNGSKFAMSASGGSADGSAITDDGASDLCIAARASGTTLLDGRVFLIPMWNRVLSDAEAFRLTSRASAPWSLIRSVRPRPAAGVSAAGTFFNPMTGRGGGAAQPLA
jgi:hypothetical protein